MALEILLDTEIIVKMNSYGHIIHTNLPALLKKCELKITEEKTEKGSFFYIREIPFIPGRSIQATALTFEAAEWMAEKIKISVDRL